MSRLSIELNDVHQSAGLESPKKLMLTTLIYRSPRPTPAPSFNIPVEGKNNVQPLVNPRTPEMDESYVHSTPNTARDHHTEQSQVHRQDRRRNIPRDDAKEQRQTYMYYSSPLPLETMIANTNNSRIPRRNNPPRVRRNIPIQAFRFYPPQARARRWTYGRGIR